MVDPTILAPIPRSFLAEAPVATVNVGLALINRRSSALADFWRSCAEVREPTDLMAVQLNYWTKMVDDYKEAISEGLSQVVAAESADAASAPAAPAAPDAPAAPPG